MDVSDVLALLEGMADAKVNESKGRHGINTSRSLGIPIPALRALAAETGRDHELALKLWSSEVPEARILASMIDEPACVTSGQMDAWVRDLDSWDICDQCCSNLFDKTPFAREKVFTWSQRQEEFVKRAAFTLAAVLAVHDKKAPDEIFLGFLPVIERESTDGRNFVKKAVNWSLRQIGKRNRSLNRAAIAVARRIEEMDSPSAKWIAGDALRELEGARVQARLRA